MPSYKLQHFLPAAYLREFSADPPPITRRSRVWRVDRVRSVLVTVQSQCADDYFYSKKQPEAVERMFGETEGFYAECMRKIKSGIELPNREYFGFILIMFDIHIRNGAYQNLTSQENLHAYSLRLRALRSRFIVGSSGDDPSDDEVAQVLQNRWRLKFLSRHGEGGFLTSDNPSIWMASHEPTPRLAMMIMPITPHLVAIAYDRRFNQVEGNQTTTADNGGMNHMQCRAAVDAIYSSAELPLAMQGTVRAIWQDHPARPHITTDQGWNASLLRLGQGVTFSFVSSPIPVL